MKRCLLLLLSFSLFLLGGEQIDNLLRDGQFQPVKMHGDQVTGFRSWYMWDSARNQYNVRSNKYWVSGEEYFTLDCKDGIATIRFKSPLGVPYQKNRTPIRFGSEAPRPLPPAENYLFTGRIKVNMPGVNIGYGYSVPASPEWQNFSVRGKGIQDLFLIQPAAGLEVSFADLKFQAVYPPKTGDIPLPNGGKLTKILLPKNADFFLRRNVQLWRGWLWKVTGVALPLEVSSATTPQKGAVVFIKDPARKEGSWELEVNQNGIVLRYGGKFDLAPALFDYMYRHGHRWFSRNHNIVMKYDPKSGLAAEKYTVTQRFRYMMDDLETGYMNGGLWRRSLHAVNIADYYHLPTPSEDHVMNVLMPMDKYAVSHPEYYMLGTNGQRYIDPNACYANPCLSNEEVRKLFISQSLKYLEAQPEVEMADIEIGDSPFYCHCDKCEAVNGRGKGYGNILMAFVDQLAAEMQKRGLPQTLMYCAYLSRAIPPDVVPKSNNLKVQVCIGQDQLPCTLHVDCELNKRGYGYLRQWQKHMGGRENVGIDTYRDVRPLHHLRQMEYIIQFANRELLMFDWHGNDIAQQFVTTRWNLGDSMEKAISDFNQFAYGKGAVLFAEVEKIVDEFAENYRHSPAEIETARKSRVMHIAIRGGNLETASVLTRSVYEKIYAKLDEAIVAAGNDAFARQNLLRQKASYLLEDLNANRIFACRSVAENKAFARRLKALILICREVPLLQQNVWIGVDPRRFIKVVSGLEIPNTKRDFTREALVEKFLADPESFFKLAQKVPIMGGWKFPIGMFLGGSGVITYDYQCPPQQAVSIGRPSGGKSRVQVEFEIPRAITHPLWLSLVGLDDDKPGRSTFRVLVNGTEVYKGDNLFQENNWTAMGMMIPGLKAGVNQVVVENITPDAPSRSARYQEPDKAAGDMQWGWICLSGMYIVDVQNQTAQAFRAQWARWRPLDEPKYKPYGKVKMADGRLALEGSTAPETGIVFCRNHQVPKLAAAPGQIVRFKVTASGSGKLHMGFWPYDYRNWYIGGQNTEKICTLTAEPKTFVVEIAAPAKCSTILPVISVLKQGKAQITSCQIEVK